MMASSAQCEPDWCRSEIVTAQQTPCSHQYILYIEILVTGRWEYGTVDGQCTCRHKMRATNLDTSTPLISFTQSRDESPVGDVIRLEPMLQHDVKDRDRICRGFRAAAVACAEGGVGDGRVWLLLEDAEVLENGKPLSPAAGLGTLCDEFRENGQVEGDNC
jgi:hypothetical protein